MAAARARDGAKGDAAHIEGKPARFVPTLMRALRLAQSISTETSAAAREVFFW